MKVLSTIIRYILVFALAVSIVIVLLINIASSTILDKNYVLNKLEETGYYEGIYLEIQDNFAKHSGQSGFDDEDMKDVVTLDKIKKDTNIIVSNIYDGKDEEIDIQEIKDRLDEKVKEAMNKLGVTADKKAVDEFVNEICQEYKTTMVHTEYEHNINNMYNKVLNLVSKLKKGLLITILVCVIMVLALCYKRIYKGIASCGVAVLTSGILSTIGNIYINEKIKIQSIAIINNTISNSVREVATNIMSKVSTFGYILLGIGILMIIIGNIIDSKKELKKEVEN